MKFNIEDYPGKCAMLCPTEESAKIFTAYLHSLGKKWKSGTSYLECTHWERYKENTCYLFNTGEYGFAIVSRRTNCRILEFYDFDWDMELPYEESNITLEEILGLEEQS